jgi:phosphomannomutase
VRANSGAAFAPEALLEVEARIGPIEKVKRIDKDEAIRRGLIEIFDPAPAYLDYLTKHIHVGPLRSAGLSVVHDPMWGTGTGWFRRILSGGATLVAEIHASRNPLFPEMARPEPIPPNVSRLLEEVVTRQASIGLATDGDSDRIGVADEKGQFINQLQVYALLALYLLEVRGQRGAIVKTLSTTSMLEKLGRLYNVPVYETGVGFKYVGPKMLETDAMIGGEESGGFAFHGLPERDGIVAGLFLLDFMVKKSMTPSQLIEHLYSLVGPHYYERIDRRLTPGQAATARKNIEAAKPTTIAGMKVTGIDTRDGFKYVLGSEGWLLIRLSGTEPLIRVYTELTDQAKVEPVLQEGLKLTGV